MNIVLAIALLAFGFALAIFNSMNILTADIAPAHARPEWERGQKTWIAFYATAWTSWVTALSLLYLDGALEINFGVFVVFSVAACPALSLLAAWCARRIVKRKYPVEYQNYMEWIHSREVR